MLAEKYHPPAATTFLILVASSQLMFPSLVVESEKEKSEMGLGWTMPLPKAHVWPREEIQLVDLESPPCSGKNIACGAGFCIMI